MGRQTSVSYIFFLIILFMNVYKHKGRESKQLQHFATL